MTGGGAVGAAGGGGGRPAAMGEPLVLALETSAAMCSVAIASPGRVRYQWAALAPGRHSELLVPAAAAALAAMGWTPPEAGPRLAGLAVTTGPGSFTGLRIGIAAAKGLGQAWGLPLAGFSTLEVMAAACGPQVPPGAWVAAALPARRSECYAGLFEPVEAGPGAPLGWRQTGPVVVAPPAQALRQLLGLDRAAEVAAAAAAAAGPGLWLCGQPWRETRAGMGDDLGRGGHVLLGEELDWPLAKHLAGQAAAAWHRHPGMAPEQVLPVYVRRPEPAGRPEGEP